MAKNLGSFLTRSVPTIVFAIFIAFLICVGLWLVYIISRFRPPQLDTVSITPYQPIVVVAAGDLVCDPDSSPYNNGEGTGSRCHMRQTSDLAVSMNPEIVLLPGDLQYETGELSAFNSAFESTWGRLKDVISPVPGNHEYATPSAAGYFSYFPDHAGVNGKGYYAFSKGEWRFFALNSNCLAVGGCAAGSEQLTWLEEELKSSDAQCSIAFWHHSLFSSFRGRVQTAEVLQTAHFWSKLVDSGADIVINGHDHFYERFALQDENGIASDQGMRQFTVGTGGYSLYNLSGDRAANSEKSEDRFFGVLKLELFRKTYRWQFIAENGEIIDQGESRCV